MDSGIPTQENMASEADDGLLYWMLSLSSTQRLDVLAEFVALVEEMRLGRRTLLVPQGLHDAIRGDLVDDEEVWSGIARGER